MGERRARAAEDRASAAAYQVRQEVDRLEYLVARLEVLVARLEASPEEHLKVPLATPEAPRWVQQAQASAPASD
jgi:hypothetical protein